MVPLHVVQADGAPDVARLTIVIDENPAPVAAAFDLGPGMRPLDLELRVRIDAYSNVRAIVETVDGETYMTGGFVRASGGCSAPALKDQAAAMAALGEMKLRLLEETPAQSGVRRTAQVMLRHPNYSGLQLDQLTQLYIPAKFVDSLEMRQGDETLFTMSGGISISEDPTFRFAYTETGAGLSLHATDTDGAVFERHFPARHVASEAADVGLGLRPPQILDERVGHRRGPHHADALARDLAHRQHRLRRDVAVVGQDRGDRRRSSRSSAAACPGSGRSPPCRRRRTRPALPSGSRCRRRPAPPRRRAHRPRRRPR